MFAALTVLICVTLASARNLSEYSFAHYVKEFSKKYSATEMVSRQAIFEARLQDMISHNANPEAKFTKGINHMTDWTEPEISGVLGYHKGLAASLRSTMKTAPKRSPEEEAKRLALLPKSVDWRDQGVVTPVKNQGSCGSCWTFSAAETVESHWAIHTGSLQELSQQQIASCTSNPENCGGTGGCEGGVADLAYESIIKAGGLATEWSYPYRSWFGTDFECAFNTSMDMGAKIKASVKLASNEYGALMEAIADVGPVSISVDASNWHLYEGGVYDGCDTDKPDVNHAVQLVGYGTDEKQGDYWTVRNSWGTGWGEHGYIRVARNTGKCGTDTTPQDGSGCDGGPDSVNVCGMCGILYDNSYPVVDAKPDTH